MFLFLTLIVRQMRRERLRAALTVLGVTLGVAVMLAIRLANQSSLAGFESAIDSVSGKAALEITCPPLGIDETRLPQLAWLREFGIAAPVIEADVQMRTASGSEMLRLLGIDALRDPALRDYPMNDDGTGTSGMELLRFLSEPDALVLTEGFAQTHHLTAGSSVDLAFGDRRFTCRIAAILHPAPSGPGSLAQGAIGVMDIASAQVLLQRLGRIDRLELRLHEGVDVTQTEAALRNRLPAGLTVQRPQRRGEAVEKMLAAFHFNLTMLSGIALVVGLFLIYNTVSVAVMTRRREIGMLRTLGVTRAGVLSLFLGEALLLGITGALLGVPLAQLLARVAVALTSTTVDTLYIAQAAVIPGASWMQGALALAVAVPLSLAAAAKPALEAANVPPVAAITGSDAGAAHRHSRHSKVLAGPLACALLGAWAAQWPPIRSLPIGGYVAAMCAVFGVALLVPTVLRATAAGLRGSLGRALGIEGRLAASQVRASTSRLSVSVAALSVSLALSIAVAVMVSSFRKTVVYWVNQTMGADLYLRPGTPPRSVGAPAFSASTIDLVRSQSGVAAIDSYQALDLPYRDRLIKLGAANLQTASQHGRIAFKEPSDAEAAIAAARSHEAVLISESFALRFDTRIGDRITLQTRQGPHAFEVAGIFYDYSSDRGTVTMDTSIFERHFGQGQPTHLAVYLAPGTDAEALRGELLEKLARSQANVFIFTNAGLRNEVLRIFDNTFAITWALELIAIVVAMAGVAATMLTLVLERRQELRLLRIAGADARQVRRTILTESALIGSVGQILGIVVGLLLSLVLIHVINPQSFGWSIRFHLPWLFLAASTMLTIAATMLAGLYPAKRATLETLRPLEAGRE